MKASYFSKDTRDFIRLLSRHGVRCLLVGGEAVIYYGSSRLTGDADFFFDPGAANARKLFKALQEFWGGTIPEITSPKDLTVPHLILQFGVPPHRIDLVNAISGVSFSEAWSGRLEETIHLDGRDYPLFLIGIDQLIRNKKKVARPKDIDDLRFLEALKSKKTKRT